MAPNYALGKIYVIRNTGNAKLYTGSTIRTLAERMAEHRKRALANADYPLYASMRELGMEKFYIELIADFPCERCEQLNAEEGRRIRALGSLVPNGYNLNVAGRTRKEHYVNNKEAIGAQHHAYYEANKDEFKLRNRTYADTHKDAIKEQKQAYHEAHKEAIKARKHAYYIANAEEIKAKQNERNAAKAAAKLAAAPAPVAPAPAPAEPVAN